MSTKDYNSSLPNNIDRIITAKGLKQGAVAAKAGLSARQFSDMLNGRRIIKPCDVVALIEALDVTPNELYGVKSDNGTKGA